MKVYYEGASSLISSEVSKYSDMRILEFKVSSNTSGLNRRRCDNTDCNGIPRRWGMRDKVSVHNCFGMHSWSAHIWMMPTFGHIPARCCELSVYTYSYHSSLFLLSQMKGAFIVCHWAVPSQSSDAHFQSSSTRLLFPIQTLPCISLHSGKYYLRLVWWSVACGGGE